MGVHESATGINCLDWYSSFEMAWGDIVEFDHRPTGTLDRVYAKKANDGGWRQLPGVLQGQRVVWTNGETRDITGLLNGRLRAARV